MRTPVRIGRAMAAVILAVALVSGVLSGCGKGEKTGASVRVAQFTTDPELIRILGEAVRRAEEVNPGLTVRLESIPYANYQEKITTQMAAGNPPDVVFVEVNNFVDLYLRDAFEDLTPYAKRDGLDLSAYYPGVLGRFQRDGKLFAVPQDTAPKGLVYVRKDAFEEAGLPQPDGSWSWPGSFLEVCRRLVKKDAEGRTLRFAYSEGYGVDPENFLYSSGGNWVDDTDRPTRLTLDTPEALRAFRYRWDLIHVHGVSPSPSQLQTFTAGSGVEAMFENGKIALMASGIWHTPRFLKRKDLRFDGVVFPAGPAGPGWATGGSGFAISRGSRNKEAAWKVVRALTSRENLERLAGTGMLQPALRQVAESDAFLKAPGVANKAILLSMPKHAHYTPFLGGWSEILYGRIQPALDPVWNGEKKPEDVLPELTRRVNAEFFGSTP